MISLLRVDDKLLHGQIAFSWVMKFCIHTLLIVDDEIINDSFMKMTLGLSKPQGVNLKILSVKNSIKYLQMASKDKNMMIIVKNMQNAQILIQELKLQQLNIGLLRTNNQVVYQLNDISFDQEDYLICKDLIRTGVRVDLRLTANDAPINLNEKLK